MLRAADPRRTGFVRTAGALHNEQTEATLAIRNSKPGSPNVAAVGDFSLPRCRTANVASFAKFSIARRVSFTIVAHPITRPGTPSRPEDNVKSDHDERCMQCGTGKDGCIGREGINGRIEQFQSIRIGGMTFWGRSNPVHYAKRQGEWCAAQLQNFVLLR